MLGASDLKAKLGHLLPLRPKGYVSPDWIGRGGRETEREWIKKRRTALTPKGASWPTPEDYTLGLALSGGGIRSATFCLGALYSLDRLGLLRAFDYLSTVSGGGYAGSFLGSLFARDYPATSKPEESFDKANPLGTELGVKALRHLRDSGRYLLPGGSGDALRLFAIAIRNWLGLHLTLGLFFLTLFLILKPFQAAATSSGAVSDLQLWMVGREMPSWTWPIEWLHGLPIGPVLASPLWPLILPLIFGALVYGWAYWLTQRDVVWAIRGFEILKPPVLGTALIFFMGLTAALAPQFVGSGETVEISPLARQIAPGAPATIETPATPLCSADSAQGGEIVARGVACALRAGRFNSPYFWWLPVAVSGAVLLLYAAHRIWAAIDYRDRSQSSASHIEAMDRIRSRLTTGLALCIKGIILIAGLAALDTIAQTLYAGYLQSRISGPTIATSGATVLALLPVARTLLRRLSGKKFGDLLRRFGRWIALASALLLATGIFAFWALLAHAIAWRGGPIGTLEAWSSDGALGQLIVLTAIFAALTALAGVSYSFLNESSFSSFYMSRLKRAYLGASNPKRIGNHLPVDREDVSDDLSLEEYYRPETGAPVHLINVTVNRTAGSAKSGAGSRLVQRERRGFPLVVSPGGFLYSETASNGPLTEVAFSDTNQLTLGSWVAISGAAVSTGLGQRTSLGLALLAGIANLRLGYWWESKPPSFRLGRWWRHSTFNFLRKEFLARFYGAHDARWYLTDGGHFENTGVYELIRRRVTFIVACDNGADPKYEFDDVVNLVRKARIDFGAEIDFLTKEELDDTFGTNTGHPRMAFGTLDQLAAPWTTDEPGPYAALARIRYASDDGEKGPTDGTLILIKPRLRGQEAPDLLKYQKVANEFPQQTTGDQFFDEAQWEGYHSLGRTIIDAIFDYREYATGLKWLPSNLETLPPRKTAASTCIPTWGKRG